MPIVQLADKQELIPTCQFPSYITFPFEHFNPVQSGIYDVYNKDCNIVIASSTSSGKTVCAEMFIANEIFERGKKAVYLAPLKALAKEKIDDWTSNTHAFSKKQLSICTGDYRLTADRKKELASSNIVLMTTEMLNSRVRNFESENSEWLKDIGTLVCDEAHLLTVPGRGDHLEVAFMKLTKINPNVRLVLLSATMPNVKQITEWLQTLNNKETFLIESTYRPCPLQHHIKKYDKCGSYDDTEKEKIDVAMSIIEENIDDKFLVFTHTKRTGKMALEKFQEAGYKAEFHCADLTKEKRQDLEERFKNGDLQIIIATSTLAWGVNLPSRRVIILGMHRGLQEVETYDLKQMAGRAGRPKYDPKGDVYYLLPDDDKYFDYVEKIQTQQDITSRLLDFIGGGHEKHYKTLAFHLVSEIHHGYIKTKEEVHQWYARSLACYQANDLDDSIIDSTLALLLKCNAIKEEEGIYKTTVVGMLSSLFYYSPFDIADLRKNFNSLFKNNCENNDLIVSMCLGNIDSLKLGIVNKAERLEMSRYNKEIAALYGENKFLNGAIKNGYAYFAMMNGHRTEALTSTTTLLQWDFARLKEVLQAMNSVSKWNKKAFFERLGIRVAYGVREELVEFCKLPDIGRVRAEKLWAAGFRNYDDILMYQQKLLGVLNFSVDKVKGLCDYIKTERMVSG